MHMALSGYGVLKGPLFVPAEQTQQGKWFHGIFYVSYPGTGIPRECATDFSSATADNIQYRIFQNLPRDLFSTMTALADGYHDLASNPESGAMDYVRSPLLGTTGWILSDGDNAVSALQQLLSSGPQRVYVFGESFIDPAPVKRNGVQSQSGMHNIHMNQGDPPSSPDGQDHQVDDGIWQDGCTVFEAADGTLTAFCNKFVSQTFNTNDQGLPA
jgi:hypothetical protein